MGQFETPHRSDTSDPLYGNTSPNLAERAADGVEDIKAKGREAATAFSDVADAFGDALDESIRTRPYATLAIAAGIGFLFGAAWSR